MRGVKSPLALSKIFNWEGERKMLYRLKGGNHNHSDGKTYKNGDIIDTDVDLAKKFPHKFEPIHDELEASEGTPFPSISITRPKSKVTVVDMPTEEETKEDTPVADVEAETGEKKAGEKVDRGKDVTKKFPSAVENELKVFEKGRKFFIYDLDPNAPLNEKGLTKAKAVKFIQEYLED